MSNFLKRNRIEVQSPDSPEVNIDVDIDQIRAANVAREALAHAQKLHLYERYETPSGYLSPKHARQAQSDAREIVDAMEQRHPQ